MTQRPSVLIVDDTVDDREMLVEYLRFCGFPVTEAAGGAEAIQIAGAIHPDVILMDLSMPEIDGWEATRRLKADPLTKNAIIVAMTAHAFQRERDAARDAGCAALIVKPFDLEVLADALGRLTSVGLSAFENARLSDTSPT